MHPPRTIERAPRAAPPRADFPAHILVVDDEPEIAHSLAELLARVAGYQVTINCDGSEAMATLEASHADGQETIDLVLLDVRMPNVRGTEVLKWLRNHPSLKYMRVIVLTAAASDEEKVEALSAGADDYITKPYKPLELLARVKTILRSQELEKQLQRQGQQLATLNRYSQSVAAKLSQAEVLAATGEGAQAVFNAELVAIFLAGRQPPHLTCQHLFPSTGGLSAADFAAVASGVGIIGLTHATAEGLCLNHPHDDEGFRPGIDAPSGKTVESMITTPMMVRGRPVGVIVAYNKEDGPFGEVDQGLFASLASSASRALENAWLVQSLRLRQEELLASRNELQAVIDGILHPIYTIDEQFQLVAINQSRADTLPTGPEDFVGRRCFERLFGREKPCSHCQVAMALTNRAPKQWSASLEGEGLYPEEWEVNAFPIPGSKAGAAQAVVVWQDRTEERRLERSLVRAGKLAAIGQLAAGVAHEINNPLTVINANAQMLQMSIDEADDNYEPVELIAQAVDRAAQVIRGLLDFARENHYSFSETDINDSIRQSLNLVSYQLAAADIKVTTHLADDLPAVEGSWEHLQSVWLNLILNARDALQDRPSPREIEIVSRPDPIDDAVLILVRDNGHGMSEADMAHVFEPFFTTKAPGQGTGLGLATCHRIIEYHGGHIEARSAPNEGTLMVVQLPVHRPSADAAAGRTA